MVSRCTLVSLFLVFVVGIVFAVISGVVIHEYTALDNYVKMQCTDFRNSTISSYYNHYKCEGYATLYNSTETVKLHYPTLNYLLFDTSESGCNEWIKELQNGVFECYVYLGNEYTDVVLIFLWIIMFIIGMTMMIAVPSIVVVLLMMKKNTKRHGYESIDDLILAD